MKDVKDWYDKTEDITIVKCERKNTVLLFNINDPLLHVLRELEKELDVEMVITRSMTDLLALPAFLAIVNPNIISKHQIEEHFEFICKYFGPSDCHYLFTEDFDAKIFYELKSAIIKRPVLINKNSLKQIIIQTKTILV